jgi:hypothetical protein
MRNGLKLALAEDVTVGICPIGQVIGLTVTWPAGSGIPALRNL